MVNGGPPATVGAGGAALGPGTPVGDLPLRPVVALAGNVTVQQVAQALVRSGASAVIVGASEAVVTDADVVEAVAAGRSPCEPAVSIARDRARHIPAHAPALEALTTMLHQGCPALVVVEGGRPLGMVTLAQAARVVVNEAETPTWLPALRTALHLEVRIEPGG